MASSTPHFLSTRLALPISILSFLIYLPTTSAYSWAFQSTPKQCSNLTVTISGNDGVPPYRILIIPFGASPLSNNVEARKIMDVKFDDNKNSVDFELNYPANSQFVAVVSDSKAFGSGGTSVAALVGDSDDDSCFSTKTSVSPQFTFSIEPPNQVVQCQAMRIWWDPTVVQGIPNFLGVIPGGQSFSVPQSANTTVASEGTGFTWTPSVRGGTTLIIVGGDNRGNGTAGSTLNVVSSGINNNNTCLTDASPSSTPGSPAGGSYPTNTSGGSGSSGGGGGGSSNTGAIVGGVIGGLIFLVAIVLLLWFFRKRQRVQARFKERPVDLMNADDDDGDEPPANGRLRTNELPQYYQPEPFMVPDPTLNGSIADTDDVEGRRPLSGATSSFYTRDTGATTPDPASASLLGFGTGVQGSSTGQERRKGAPRPMRAVNVIQHDDAGPSFPLSEDKDGEDEPETIELPPAYTAVGRRGAAKTEVSAPPVEAGSSN